MSVENHGLNQARLQVESIEALVAALDNRRRRDDALDAILEDPLEVTVRSGWYAPGSEGSGLPEEFCILLCTGGPAVRIVGELDVGSVPIKPRVEYQNWFEPWKELPLGDKKRAAVLRYVQCFFPD